MPTKWSPEFGWPIAAFNPEIIHDIRNMYLRSNLSRQQVEHICSKSYGLNGLGLRSSRSADVLGDMYLRPNLSKKAFPGQPLAVFLQVCTAQSALFQGQFDSADPAENKLLIGELACAESLVATAVRPLCDASDINICFQRSMQHHFTLDKWKHNASQLTSRRTCVMQLTLA